MNVRLSPHARRAKHVRSTSPLKEILFCAVRVTVTSPPTGRQTVCGSTDTTYLRFSVGVTTGTGLSQFVGAVCCAGCLPSSAGGSPALTGAEQAKQDKVAIR